MLKRPPEVPNPLRILFRKLAIASPMWALGGVVGLNRLFFGELELCPPFREYADIASWRKLVRIVKGLAALSILKISPAPLQDFLIDRRRRLGRRGTTVFIALKVSPRSLQEKLLKRFPNLIGELDFSKQQRRTRRQLQQELRLKRFEVRRRELQMLSAKVDNAKVDLSKGALYKDLHPIDIELYESLPKTVEGQRSVVFLNHSYYHHYYLAKALRKRGWNAISIVGEDPSSSSARFYHGEDVSIWDPDPAVVKKRSYSVMRYVEEYTQMLFWHNENLSSIFQDCYQNAGRDRTPWDLIYLRQKGVKLGVSMSGCLTGTGQTEFNKYTGGVCDNCIWQNNSEVCSDPKNLAVGQMFSSLTDLYAIEGDWVVNQSRKTERAYREPLTFCLDHELWHPDISVPKEMKFDKDESEILIFHAVGNYSARDSGTRNIKGTPAILDAVDRLKSEGFPVKLIFVHDVHSRDMRFYQVQADIIVDQIIYGRYGAASRESMMLGKPTITKLVREQPKEVGPSQSLEECPLIDANPESIYGVLRHLVLHPEERERIGRESREYAVKWHSANACAARFERVYDRLLSGHAPLDVEETYHG